MGRILIFLLALLPLAASSDGIKSHCMVVYLKSGDQVRFLVSEKPQITFENDVLRISSNTSTIDYIRSDVDEFYFEEIETGIETLEYVGDGVVSIFDMSGQLITTLRGETPQVAKFLLNSFKPGLYIIKIGNQSIKYLKK